MGQKYWGVASKGGVIYFFWCWLREPQHDSSNTGCFFNAKAQGFCLLCFVLGVAKDALLV